METTKNENVNSDFKNPPLTAYDLIRSATSEIDLVAYQLQEKLIESGKLLDEKNMFYKISLKYEVDTIPENQKIIECGEYTYFISSKQSPDELKNMAKEYFYSKYKAHTVVHIEIQEINLSQGVLYESDFTRAFFVKEIKKV